MGVCARAAPRPIQCERETQAFSRKSKHCVRGTRWVGAPGKLDGTSSMPPQENEVSQLAQRGADWHPADTAARLSAADLLPVPVASCESAILESERGCSGTGKTGAVSPVR